MVKNVAKSGFSLYEYIKSYHDKAYPDGSNLHYWNHGRNKIIRRKITSFIQPCNTILDIGCGRGITVKYLRQNGFNCFGCDIAPVRPISPDISSYLYIDTDAFSLQENFRCKVDTILLLDVLEHLHQPKKFLSECKMKFQNLRNILITVPARMELWSNYDEYYKHSTRYDRKTLSRMLDGLHFGNIEIGYFFHLLYVSARLFSILDIPRNVEIKPPMTTMTIKANNYLAQFFNMEEKIVPKWVPGTSICAVVNIK